MAVIQLDRDSGLPPGGWPTPKSAYVHVPFCRHRCGYCNFSVVADRDQWIENYLDAIDAELAALESPTVSTLFLGGGTPTHLPPTALERLLKLVRHRFSLNREGEFSVEANPEDIDPAKLRQLRDHGVNRMSLGVQSFNDSKLKVLERGHRAKQACRTIEQVADVIPNLSIDLIFSAPGETAEEWDEELQTAFSLPIRHLSTYALTFEKGTSFWSRRFHGELSDNDESVEVAMYQAARQRAKEYGFDHYEVSNFSRPGFRCQHNMSYWHGDGWFAAGPGAARFVSGVREVNHRSTSTYLRRMERGQSPTAEREAISVEQFARERAAFGVRVLDGIQFREFQKATGVDLRELCESAVDRSVNEELIEVSDDVLKLSERGVLFADTVASRFLSD